MTNPFGTDQMAAGYANARPPVHPRILDRARRILPSAIARALDVGCGAGLSTRALEGVANQSIGMEPVEAMLRWTRTVAPACEFLVGAAEAIPLAARSMDLITAAGSLNYVDLDLFFREAARVLANGGVLLVYDFSAGRKFSNGPGLEAWFSTFRGRYPVPANEARSLDPVVLDHVGGNFRVRSHETFAIGLPMSHRSYLDYMMTETNVAFAVRNGTPYGDIRAWCEDTLGTVWQTEEREVVFTAYFACMTPG
jgi:SAM-dependent methyltransferase